VAIRKITKDYPIARKAGDCSNSRYFLVRSVDSLDCNNRFLFPEACPYFSTSILDLRNPNWYRKNCRRILLVYTITDSEDVIGMYSSDGGTDVHPVEYTSDSFAVQLFIDDRIRRGRLTTPHPDFRFAMPFKELLRTGYCEVMLRSSVKPIAVIIDGDIGLGLMEGVRRFSDFYALSVYRIGDTATLEQADC